MTEADPFQDTGVASEWQQASQLLLMLLQRLPYTDVGAEAVGSGTDPADLEELMPLS